MADRKISDLTALTTPATGDLLPIVDVSEAAAADKNKSITIQELFKGVPDGTAAAPGLAFESDDGNGIYKPGTDQVAISTGGSARLFIDASGRVGVGTTSPADILHLESNTPRLIIDDTNGTGNNARPGIIMRDSGNTNLFTIGNFTTADSDLNIRNLNSSGALVVWTGNNETFRIDSSGRLLVGTSNSNAGEHKLQIQGNANSTASNGGIAIRRGQTNPASNEWLGQISFTDAAGSEGAYINGEVDGSNWAASDYPTRLTFATTADGASTPTERMRIDSAGRVGVGTTNPSHPLTIQSDFSNSFAIQANSDTTLKLMLGYSYTNDYARIASEDAGVNQKDIFQHALNHRWGRNNSTEYMRLDSSGRLGIGTSSPSQLFDAVGTGVQIGGNYYKIGDFRHSTSSPKGVSFGYDNANSVGIIAPYGTNDLGFWGWNGSSWGERVRFTASGNVGIGTTSPGAKAEISQSTGGDPILRLRDSANVQTANFSIDSNKKIDLRGGSSTSAFSFTNDSTERARIDSSGRLLVGTTSGTESVHVNGAIASVGTSSSFSSGAKRAFFDYNGGANRARIGVTSGANNAAQAISFHTSPSGAAAGSFERFRIGEVGQLGIGGATYGTSGQVLTSNGSSSAPSWQDAGSGSAPSFASICDEKSAGTYGGNPVSGTWTTRDLNTELSDPDGIVSISSNQFTLGAGTYTLIVTAPFYRTEETLLRVKNVTDTTYYRATTGYHRNATYVETVMTMAVTFTISASKAFAVQYRCGSETFGLGVTAPSSWGTSIYTKVDIIKYA